jgi:hypothetical protein
MHGEPNHTTYRPTVTRRALNVDTSHCSQSMLNSRYFAAQTLPIHDAVHRPVMDQLHAASEKGLPWIAERQIVNMERGERPELRS